MWTIHVLVFLSSLILFIANAYVWLDEHNKYNQTAKISYYHRDEYIRNSLIASGFGIFLIGVLSITISYLFY